MAGNWSDPLEQLRQQAERLRQEVLNAPSRAAVRPRPAAPLTPASAEPAAPTEDAALLRQLIDGSDDAIHALDLQGRYLLANPAALRLLGQPLEAVLGQPRERFLQLRAALASSQVDRQVAISGEPARLLEQFHGPEGQSEWMSHRFALRNADGRVLGVGAIARDVTQERDLQGQARLSEALFQHSQSALLVLGTQGQISRVNPRFEELFGFSATSVLGRDFSRLFLRAESGQPGHALWQQVTEQGHWSGELQLRSADGRELTCWASFASLSADDGQHQGFMAQLTDMTELSQARAELLRHRDHLEDLVAERTRELELARQAAEAADAAKSTFLSTVSHELRTPLNVITGMAWLLRQASLTPQQQEQLRELQGAGEQLSAIITDLLQFVRLEAEEALPPAREFQPAALLSEALTRHVARASAKGLTLTSHIEPAVPQRLIGPADQIGLVLDRLLGNAIKFTERGEVALGLREVGREHARVLLEFEVRDTGIGMDAAVQQRLFQPFTQGEAVLTRQFGGLGLGLSVARRILDRLGGEIGADSTPGQGSRFWFRLVAQLVPSDATGDAATRAATLPASTADSVAEALPAIEAADLALWPALRRQLCALLEQNDVDVMGLWQQHDSLLRTALGERHVRIDDAIQQFNFEHALALVQEER